MKTGKVLIGTLAGIAVGAIAGILFAPGKGSKTRKQIKNNGDDYRDKLKSKVDGFVDKGKAKFYNARKM